MKRIHGEDRDGFALVSMVRDQDSETHPEIGIKLSIDLREIDWKEVAKELQANLIKNGLITWDDVMKSRNGVASTILSVIDPKIKGLYREAFRKGDK